MPQNTLMQIKGKIVTVPFPFDDQSTLKRRPALCLSRVIGVHHHIVVAYITTALKVPSLPSDLEILQSHPDFALTGLQTDSLLRLHHLATVKSENIVRELGRLPADLEVEVEAKLRRLFGLEGDPK